jgi:peptidoglycan/LPS O-acetylase OafA/YrhL
VYFPALDGLRFVLCAMVVIGHSFLDPALAPQTQDPLHRLLHGLGGTGVELFFSLSGFLITTLLLEERARFGRVDLFAFYIRRTLRIWPVYFAAIFLCFGLLLIFPGSFGSPADPRAFSVGLPALLLFVSNWIHVPLPSPLLVLWSVGVEEQFYLLFPLTFVFSRRAHPVFRAVGIGLAIAILSRWAMSKSGYSIHATTPAVADELLLGALLAQLARSHPERVRAFFRHLELPAIFAVLAVNQWGPSLIGEAWGWILYPLLSGAASTLLVGALAFGSGSFAQLQAGRRWRNLGQLTYAGYVFHMYAVVLATSVVLHRFHLVGWMAFLARALLAVPLTMLLAFLVRISFEQRILKLKARFTRVTVRPGARK